MSINTLVNPAQFEAIFTEAPHLQAFLRLCAAENVKTYLVGGAVRDLLFRGELSKDLDFVVSAAASKSLAEAIAQQLDGKCICLDERFQIYRVILFPGLEMLDIAGCIGKDIHEDLLRRDLTINAIAYDFGQKTLLDPTGGQTDLQRGLLKMVSEANMLDDPLRMLRVFRIGAELGFFQIDPATFQTISAHGEKLIRAASERIHYEMMKMLSAPQCFYHLRRMADIRLLEHIYPELSPCRQIPPNQFHHLGLFEHTLELVHQAEVHFADLPEAVQEALNTYLNPFTKRLAVARLACLFHDIGKPPTMEYDAEKDKYKFYGHDAVSEILTLGISLRLKWGKDITRSVASLVRWHLYPGDLLKPETTEKAFRKFFRRVGEVLPEMILLAICDRYSTQGPAVDTSELADKKAGLIHMWDRYRDFKTADEARSKLLSGGEVMKLLGLPPGPEIGHILTELSEAHLNGELSSAQEAVDWLTAHYKVSE